jgi:hypothetical protein
MMKFKLLALALVVLPISTFASGLSTDLFTIHGVCHEKTDSGVENSVDEWTGYLNKKNEGTPPFTEFYTELTEEWSAWDSCTYTLNNNTKAVTCTNAKNPPCDSAEALLAALEE